MKYRRQAQPEPQPVDYIQLREIEAATWRELQNLGAEHGLKVVGVRREDLEAAILEAMQ
jgi:hypothetical protein